MQRVRVLAEAAAAQNFPVAVISGGREHPTFANPSIKLFQLPIITAGSRINDLVDFAGSPVDDSLWKQRSFLIKQIVLEFHPAIVITEGFPFARRRFAQEIHHLIDIVKTSQNNPSIVCSVRDIIQPIERNDRQNQVIATLNEHYDHIFVHGEERFVPLQDSFGRLNEIHTPLSYTGYLDTAAIAHKSLPRTAGWILVSAGGGVAGQAIYETAMQAALTAGRAAWNWHILIGHAVNERSFQRWRQRASHNVTVERNRRDFRQLLASCQISISQIGYNTAVDLVQTGTKGVVVPYDADGEKEQMMRARALEQFNHVKVLEASDLNAKTLVDRISCMMHEELEPVSPFQASGKQRFLQQLNSLYPDQS